jgi:hypothetical protein
LRSAIENSEIVLYGLIALTVLITDGASTTDGTPAADAIKAAGHPLFAIGIDPNGNLVHLEALASMGPYGLKNFYHIRDYAALENIGHYIACK